MTVLEEVVMAGIVHMGGHQVLLIAGDQVLIMVETAVQLMIGTMVQCMTGEGVLIMGGTEVLFQSMIGAGVLIMEGTGVPTLVDTAADHQLEGQELEASYTCREEAGSAILSFCGSLAALDVLCINRILQLEIQSVLGCTCMVGYGFLAFAVKMVFEPYHLSV